MTAAPDGTQGQTLEMVDLQRLRYVILEPFTKTSITFNHSRKYLLGDIEPGCPADVSKNGLPAGQWLGYSVISVKNQLGTEESEEALVAPDLDCYSLHYSRRFASGARNERMVTSILDVPPPAELWEIPVGYVERSPSAASAQYQIQFPRHPLWDGAYLALLDSRYDARK